MALNIRLNKLTWPAESEWPDETTTGPTVSMTAVPGSATSGTGWSWNSGDGVIYITGASATVNALDVDGGIVIQASGVTLTNCRATLDDADIAGIQILGDNATVEDCEIIGGYGSSGIIADGVGQNLIWVDSADNAIIRRCDISGGENGIMISGLNCLFEDNYIHDLPPEATADRALGTNPIATTNGSPTITVTDTGHGRSVGQLQWLTSLTAVGGFTTNQLNSEVAGPHTIASVPNANTYTITMGSNANATTTGGGSGGVVLDYVAGDPHTDGIQLFGDGAAAGATVTGNNVVCPEHCTSAMIMGPNAAGIADYTVTDNRFEGGIAVFRPYKDATCTYTGNYVLLTNSLTGAVHTTDNGTGTGTPTWSGNINLNNSTTLDPPW